jgi:hypothetical protein
MCYKITIAFSVPIDEPIDPKNQILYLRIITLSILEDKEYSKPNGLVKPKVLQRVTSSGEFLISRYFVLFFIMK